MDSARAQAAGGAIDLQPCDNHQEILNAVAIESEAKLLPDSTTNREAHLDFMIEIVNFLMKVIIFSK